MRMTFEKKRKNPPGGENSGRWKKTTRLAKSEKSKTRKQKKKER